MKGLKTYHLFFLATLALLFLASSVSASEPSQVFKRGQAGDIVFLCFNNSTVCGPSTACNLSVYYPNQSLFLNKVNMTNLLDGRFSYTLSVNQTQVVGSYYNIALCWNGGAVAIPSAFTYLVTTSGSDSGENGTLGLIIILCFLSLIFCITAVSFPAERWLMRSILFMAALLVMVITVNIGVNLAASDNIIRLMNTVLLIVVVASVIFFLYIFISYFTGMARAVRDVKKEKKENP